MCEDNYSGSELFVPVSKAPSTSTLQYLPHCYLQKSLLSFKVYIDTISPSSCWDFLHLGEALRGGVPCSERTVSQPTSNLISLPASNRMISFPLTSSLCDFNRAEVNITPVNQPFLFICAEAELWSQQERGEKAKFCLPGLPRYPTFCGSRSALRRWVAVFCNCNNNYKSNNNK